ncbi:MAG: polysaccharide deacetylase family protein [Firmicutes bacterium]|nr:polysaccharide deacetylase family protein [Bacillota bacterium]
MSIKNNSLKILIWSGLILTLSVYGWMNFSSGTGFLAPRTAATNTEAAAEKPTLSPLAVYYTDQAAILVYHHLDDNETGATISPQHFAAQIASLKNKGYNFISLKQLGDFLAGQQEIAPNAIVITFDDGYESVYKYAYPILVENHIPASIFVIVKNVGLTENQIPKLTWDQMQAMQAQGMSFYSHTYNSHQLVRRQDGTEAPALISPQYLPSQQRDENWSEYRARIAEDLRRSQTTLENTLHSEVNFLALPYGLGNATVTQTAQQLGYDFLLSVDPGMVNKNSDPWALKRINAGQSCMDGEALHSTILSYIR